MKRRRLRRLILVAIAGVILFLSYPAFHWIRWRERADSATGVALELGPAQQVIKAGEVPDLVVTVVNRGSQDVVLVEPGDGSDYGWRTPVIEWSRKPWLLPARCGNINALKADEVFSLKPGESRQLKWVSVPYLPAPGRYRVAIQYTNQPDHEWVGMPLREHDEAAMRAVQGSTALSAVSNSVEIVVAE